MKIKRYEIIPDPGTDKFRVLDKLRDDFVCIPLVCDSEDELIEIMGEGMNELVGSNQVHPGYLTKET